MLADVAIGILFKRDGASDRCREKPPGFIAGTAAHHAERNGTGLQFFEPFIS
jgi:hypothetical protein